MERNSLEFDLIQTFNKVIMLGLNEQTSRDVERVLTALVDYKCDSLYEGNKVCNFLLFLKSQNNSSFLINHLIDEVERKSLRLYYTKNLLNNSNSNTCSCNQPQKNNKPQKKTEIDVFNLSPVSKILENSK